MDTNLCCSECGLPTYVRATLSRDADIICESCGNAVCWSDFQLDNGETLVFDDDGYLCVLPPADDDDEEEDAA